MEGEGIGFMVWIAEIDLRRCSCEEDPGSGSEVGSGPGARAEAVAGSGSGGYVGAVAVLAELGSG